MAEVKRTTLKTPSKCNCAKPQVFLEFNYPMEVEDLAYFVAGGFRGVKSYLDIGIFYIEDINLIALAPFGTNKLQIKCKNTACEPSIVKLEALLRNCK